MGGTRRDVRMFPPGSTERWTIKLFEFCVLCFVFCMCVCVCKCVFFFFFRVDFDDTYSRFGAGSDRTLWSDAQGKKNLIEQENANAKTLEHSFPYLYSLQEQLFVPLCVQIKEFINPRIVADVFLLAHTIPRLHMRSFRKHSWVRTHAVHNLVVCAFLRLCINCSDVASTLHPEPVFLSDGK